jgi:alcohol dehydrogenase
MAGAALPFIAIPTTAGTGSDLTRWATIWDSEASTKHSLEREDIYAEATIIDPLIMASLPWAVTLASGLDALSHALESIWNRNANPISRNLAISAASTIMQALPQLQADRHDRDARKGLALGALQAGLAFSNTRTALAHNMSYPITLAHNVPHGIACSFCLPEVLIAALGADPACDEALQAIFGNLAEAPTQLRQFLNGLEVPAKHEEFGITAAVWRSYVEDGFAGPRGRNFIGRLEDFPFEDTLLPLRAHLA